MSITASKASERLAVHIDHTMYQYLTGSKPFTYMEKEPDAPPKLVRLGRNHYAVKSAKGKTMAVYRCSYAEARERLVVLLTTLRLTK